jgi:hypothetical protein
MIVNCTFTINKVGGVRGSIKSTNHKKNKQVLKLKLSSSPILLGQKSPSNNNVVYI